MPNPGGYGRRLDATGRRPLFGGLNYVSSSLDTSNIQYTNYGCYCQANDKFVTSVAASGSAF